MTALTEKPQVGYDAFRIEYSPKINPHALEKDLRSYLGEYRFRVQKYRYELSYGSFENGDRHLSDIDGHEPMVDKAQRAIEMRTKDGKGQSREIAEKKGIVSLEHQLKNAQFGDHVVWISPPGSKEEGYGDYGFIFVGVVDKVDQFNQNKHLSMTALRVDQPQITQFNSLLSFLTGTNIKFSNAEQFLAMPKVLPYVDQSIQGLIIDILNLQPSENDKFYENALPLLSPSIAEFTDFVRQGKSRDFLFKALQSIELYTLDLIKQYKKQNDILNYSLIDRVPLQTIMYYYQGQKPPAVAGSCGGSNSSSTESLTSNVFNKYSSLNTLFSNNAKEDEYGPLKFVCPHSDCGRENTRTPHKLEETCQHCHKFIPRC